MTIAVAKLLILMGRISPMRAFGIGPTPRPNASAIDMKHSGCNISLILANMTGLYSYKQQIKTERFIR